MYENPAVDEGRRLRSQRDSAWRDDQLVARLTSCLPRSHGVDNRDARE
jgi:hypothetical protein